MTEQEQRRCAGVEGLCLLDTPAEERFDRLTRLTQRVFQAPFAIVSLVHEKRQWFKSSQGLPIAQTPREESFCQFTILQNEQLVVPDARLDSRFAELPAVTQMGIRFYAGAPIEVEGQSVGTLCVLDVVPREFSPEDRQALQDLADCVQSEMRLKGLLEPEQELHSKMEEPQRQQAVDPVTRCWGTESTMALLHSMRESPSSADLAVLLLEVQRVADYRESLGEAAAELLLRTAADRIRGAVRTETSLGRLNESRFLVVFPKLDTVRGEAKCQGVLTVMGMQRVHHEGKSMAIQAKGGLAYAHKRGESDEALLARATSALERAKKAPSGLSRAF